MSTVADELTQQARSLPPQDRARMAQDLLASLDEASDRSSEEAWDAEIRRRLDEIEVGTARLIPAAEVFAEVRRMLK